MYLLKVYCATIRYCSCLVLLLCSYLVDAKSITIVASPWQGLTHEDGSGLYFEIFREAMATQDIQIHVRLTNWKRAKHMFYANRVDVLLADYHQEEQRRFYPRWHLDYDQSVQVYTLQPLQHLNLLKEQSVGWVLGYDFDQYLPVPVKAYEVATEQEGFMLLQHQRLAAFISYKKHEPEPHHLPLYRLEILSAQPLYPLFHNDFQGRQLARAYDLGMEILYKSGRLAELHQSQASFQHAAYDRVQ